MEIGVPGRGMYGWCRYMMLAVSAMVACAGSFAGNLTGARWIGVPGHDLPFYAPYRPVFRLSFDFQPAAEGHVGIRYGVDDPRLMDSNLNIYNLKASPGESAIRLIVDADGEIAIYRSGYHPDDDPSKPLSTFDGRAVLAEGNNHLELVSNLGYTDVTLNGYRLGMVKLGSVGNGGDYLAFPVLADVGVEIGDGGGVIRNLRVNNYREPSALLVNLEGPWTASESMRLPERGMPQLRSSVRVDDGRKVRKATVTSSARGIYDLEINGRRVTEGYFYPGSTQYNRTHLFHTFDIAGYLKPGDNKIEVQLGEGWWSGPATFVGENWNFFGDRQSFAAKFEIEYEDGTTDVVVTEPDTWEYSVDGPVKTGSFFQGEIYDATIPDEDRVWKPAVEIALDSTVCHGVGSWDSIVFKESGMGAVVAVDTLTARAVSEPRPGVYVYDFGQNFAGVPLIDFSGIPRGTVATMRYAEVLYPDLPQYKAHAGMIMTENLRAAMCSDSYKVSGGGQELFSPRYTLHGYRYMEISGLDRPLPLDAVRGVAVSSVSDFKAGFSCSDSLVNRLWENILWSTRSNFISIPTDCPQRNERLGWMGDISVFAPTATRLADLSGLLSCYLQSVRDCQDDNGRFPDVAPTGFGFGGLLWGSAGITVPHELFRQYADTAMLRDHYPAMKRYIDYVFNETIERTSGVIVQNRAWSDLGDWLSPEYDRTDKSLLWECYFIHDLDIMAYVADILGYDDDRRRYAADAAARREFFNKVYIDPDTRKTRFSSFDPDRKGEIVDTQVSYALPIAFGITDDELFKSNFVATVCRENRSDRGVVCPPFSLMTGFIGTAWISEALSLIGRDDLAYKLLTSTTYPSWLYPVTQGATTVWERLDSYTHDKGFGKNNSMNSFNHYSFGAVGNWLLTRAAGIKVDVNGIVISPSPDFSGSISYVSGWVDSPLCGRVESSWMIDGNQIVFEMNLPQEGVFINPVTGERMKMSAGSHKFALSVKGADCQ